MIERIQKIFNNIHLFFIALSEIIMLVLVGIVFVNVVLRYLFKLGIPWGEEIPTNVLVPFFVFIGPARGVRENLHINFNVLPKKTPLSFQNLLLKFKYVLIILIGLVFFVYGIELVYRMRGSILPASHFISSMQYIALPLSGFLIIYNGLMNILGFHKEKEHLNSILTPLDESEIEELLAEKQGEQR